tara:strand:+ start:2010 stop:2198 length:189 start_codon:yes stop_codon:yes gene_type:complete
MKKTNRKYVNFRTSDDVHNRIVAISETMSSALNMRVSMAYVVRMVIDAGLESMENDVADNVA